MWSAKNWRLRYVRFRNFTSVLFASDILAKASDVHWNLFGEIQKCSLLKFHFFELENCLEKKRFVELLWKEQHWGLGIIKISHIFSVAVNEFRSISFDIYM